MSSAQVEVSGTAVLVLFGGVAWLIGSAALTSGVGTVVLAGGLALTVWLFAAVRRQPLAVAPLDGSRRRRVLRNIAVGIVVAGLAATLLGSQGFGEFTVPLAAVVFGIVLFPVGSALGRRGLLALGALLIALGGMGALLAAHSAGPTYPEGLVGLGAGALLWTVGAHHGGMLEGLRDRIVSR